MSKYKTYYKLNNLWWSYEDWKDEPETCDIHGPFCSSCYSTMDFPESAYTVYDNEYIELNDGWGGDVTCPLCRKKVRLKNSLEETRREISLKIKSGIRSKIEKISLEEPITDVKVRDQDNKYFLAAKIGQKDGKRVGVVYFGEKDKDQKKTDYSQIFIDLDDEQIRFDKSNKNPKDILSKLSIEFKKSTSETKFD